MYSNENGYINVNPLGVIKHDDNTIMEQILNHTQLIKSKEEKEEKDKIVIQAYVTHLICAINKLKELFDKEEEIIKFRDYLIDIGMYNNDILFLEKELLISFFKVFCNNNIFSLTNTFMELLRRMALSNSHEERLKLFPAYELYLSDIYKWGNIITDYIVQCENIPIYRFNSQKNLVLSSKSHSIEQLKAVLNNDSIRIDYIDEMKYIPISEEEYKDRIQPTIIQGDEYGNFEDNQPFGHWVTVPRVAYRFINEPLYEPLVPPDPSIPVEEMRRRTRTK